MLSRRSAAGGRWDQQEFLGAFRGATLGRDYADVRNSGRRTCRRHTDSMTRSMAGWMTRAIGLGLMLGAMAVASAADIVNLNYPVRDLIFPVRDLIFPGTGIEGNISGLQVRETAKEVRYSLSGDVLFEFGKAAMSPAAEGSLTWLLEQIRDSYAGANARVEGHTDSKGSSEYNAGLSQRRAESVAQWLASQGKGIFGKISASGLGESQPVAPNELVDGSDNPDGRKLNRRVEIIVEKR